MRLLVPAASAALIAGIALSAAAALPGTGTPSAPSSSAQREASSAQGGTVHVGPSRLPVAGLTTANTTWVAPRRGFAWPLLPRPAVIRGFEQPLSQWSPGHRGVDLSAAVGQPVLSAGDGIVAFSGVVAGRGVVTVRHSGGLRTTYEPVDERQPAGTLVHRGTRIGALSPQPGHCVPRHCLHWGAISGQAYRDPLSLLGFGRPILLPLR